MKLMIYYPPLIHLLGWYNFFFFFILLILLSRFMCGLWKVFTNGDTEDMITNLLNTKKKEVGNAIADNSDFCNYLLDSNVRIKKMGEFESVSFIVTTQMSTTSYDIAKQELDAAGYPILRNSADFAHLRAELSCIIEQRLNFRVVKERKATVIDFELFFGQLNYWLLEKDFDTESSPQLKYELEKINGDTKSTEFVNHIHVIFRTDGAPSATKTKPYLIFGFSVIYKGTELAFTEKKKKFIPGVISFAKETNEEFEYWGNIAKQNFLKSGISERGVKFGMDGGGFMRWVDCTQKTPYCKCTGIEEWKKCLCDIVLFSSIPSNGNIVNNNNYDGESLVMKDILDEQDLNTILENRKEMELTISPNTSQDEDISEIDDLDEIDDMIDNEEDIEVDGECLDTISTDEMEIENYLCCEFNASDINLCTNPPSLQDKIQSANTPNLQDKIQAAKSKILEFDFTSTAAKKWTLTGVKDLLKELNIKFNRTWTLRNNIKEICEKMVEIQNELKLGNDPSVSVDPYWLKKFILCILHGNFRLANRIVMHLFKETKDSNFYFPRFGIALTAFNIHFNIYLTRSNNYKVKPLCGHDTERLFGAMFEIIDFCLPIPELFSNDVSKEYLKNFILQKGLNINIDESDDINSIKEKIHTAMVDNKKHESANAIKNLFQRARNRYLILKNGYYYKGMFF